MSGKNKSGKVLVLLFLGVFAFMFMFACLNQNQPKSGAVAPSTPPAHKQQYRKIPLNKTINVTQTSTNGTVNTTTSMKDLIKNITPLLDYLMSSRTQANVKLAYNNAFVLPGGVIVLNYTVSSDNQQPSQPEVMKYAYFAVSPNYKDVWMLMSVGQLKAWDDYAMQQDIPSAVIPSQEYLEGPLFSSNNTNIPYFDQLKYAAGLYQKHLRIEVYAISHDSTAVEKVKVYYLGIKPSKYYVNVSAKVLFPTMRVVGRLVPAKTMMTNLTFTKDFAFLVVSPAISLSKLRSNVLLQKRTRPRSTVTVKTDKPTIQLFVMAYCPYGLQMEKAILPVIERFGDKVNFTVEFVDYSMHPQFNESYENLVQYCIQKTQKDKYLAYLSCFIQNGSYSSSNTQTDTQNCLRVAGIDQQTLDQCIRETDEKYNVMYDYNHRNTWEGGQFPPFNVEKADNIKYAVQGSPTLVINGQVVVPHGRNQEALFKLICSAFTHPPAICNTTSFPTSSEAPGFGVIGQGGSSAGAAGHCG